MAVGYLTVGHKMAPVLRNLLHRQTQRDLIVAAVLSAVAPFTFYFTVQYPRKKRYEEFYKKFDVKKEDDRLKAAGIFDGWTAWYRLWCSRNMKNWIPQSIM